MMLCCLMHAQRSSVAVRSVNASVLTVIDGYYQLPRLKRMLTILLFLHLFEFIRDNMYLFATMTDGRNWGTLSK